MYLHGILAINRGEIRMAFSKRLLGAALLAATIAGGTTRSWAGDVPSYMDEIVNAQPPSAAEIATTKVLDLNNVMFGLYDQSGALVQKSILSRHPIILGLFSGAGGRLILYRPGQPPMDAPPVPVIYQLLKSIGHSTMAIAVLAGPHIGKQGDTSWIAPLTTYRAAMEDALASLAATPMPADWLATNQALLKENITFIDGYLKKGAISFEDLQAFAQAQKDPLKLDIQWASETQVHHWMTVVADWKKSLGSSWDQTYAASNTIYVARQNNVIYSVLAQYFGPDAINSRLILIETMGFTTTPQDMLDSLTRIISDRAVGALFFGNDRLMDYELMGGTARAAVIAEDKTRGMPVVLPPVVPFGSHQWPMLVTPGKGPATLADLP
jgi:hypothetical protein